MQKSFVRKVSDKEFVKKNKHNRYTKLLLKYMCIILTRRILEPSNAPMQNYRKGLDDKSFYCQLSNYVFETKSNPDTHLCHASQ